MLTEEPVVHEVERVERELLSANEVVAVYAGQQARPCMFKTSLCPDKCGHGQTWAIFEIKKYLKHVKPGQYGDEKQDKFHFSLTKPSGARSPGMAEDQDVFVAAIQTLHEGDSVHLAWNHDKVTTHWKSGGMGSGPERPLTKMDKISAEEAEKLAASASD